jgi:hypothetical protein
MFRKVTIALLATAALAMLVPDVVSARGGGGGGMHGGGGFSGMHGGFDGGGFHGRGGFSRGGSHDARFNGHHFHSEAIRGRGFQGGFRAGFRAGLNAGASRMAVHTTVRNGQRTKMQCLSSDCSLWHSWTE